MDLITNGSISMCREKMTYVYVLYICICPFYIDCSNINNGLPPYYIITLRQQDKIITRLVAPPSALIVTVLR